MNAHTEQSTARSVQRIRHLLKARRVMVLRTQRVSPHVVRVTFGGGELHDFVSASFDDHVKLLLPTDPDAAVMLPTFDGGRPAPPPEGAPRPIGRDYTPCRFDATAGELDIEFALHGDGPAAAWAAQARPGQQVGIGGPRGSFVIPPDFDWHLLIGDETALPAIARRLAELPAGVPAMAIIEVGDVADQRPLASAADLNLQWVLRGAGDTSLAASVALLDATRALALPAGEGYAWAAGEAKVVAAVRRVLVEQHGIDKQHVRAAAYWKQGEAAHHETLAD